MSCSELLRRRQEAMPKIIAPRPIGDSSLLTQMRKYAACAGRPVGVRSDGSSVIPSSESVLYAKAGCAVCLSPKQETVTIPCCPPLPEGPKQLALQGSMPCPCPGSYVTAQLATRECCAEPGRSRTLLANDMPANFVAPPPPCQQVPRCAPEKPCETPSCVSSKPRSIPDIMSYWETVEPVEQTLQNPCKSCDA